MGVEGSHSVNRQGSEGLGRHCWRWLRPTVRGEDTVNVFLAGELDAVGVLRNVEAVEVM